MRHLRVCIYGSTDLGGTPTEFISTLAYKILDSMEAVIVTGGFHHSNLNPTATSTDVAALKGARRYAEDHGVPLRDCYEAWVPRALTWLSRFPVKSTRKWSSSRRWNSASLFFRYPSPAATQKRF